MAGKLRQAIESWVYEKIQPEGGPGWFSRARSRWREFKEKYSQFQSKQGNLPWNIDITWGIQGIVYAITGSWSPIPVLTDRISGKMGGDVSAYIGEQIVKMFASPVPNEVIESLGAIITDPVVTMFEKYSDDKYKSPKEFARAFHGFMIGLNLTGGIASTVIEAATGGQVKGAGKMLDQMYWSLGLGFLGWQTLAPLLNSGLQPRLDRYYKKLYRPARFSAGDLRDLFALGELTEAQIGEEAQYEGWRDSDIAKWIKLAYRTLNEADIWQAYHQKSITEQQATARLRALGYDPKDIPLLFRLNPPKTESEVKEFSASTARKAYSEALMSKAELLQVLKDLDYSDKEANIIVKLEDLSRVQQAKSLAVGQIKAAWNENVITDPEAHHWLELAGFAQSERDVILKTWTAEAIPEYRKLNLNTITGAYVEGIINRANAQEKLLSVGLTVEDARLELDLVEKRNPEAFGVVVPPIKKLLSPGAMADLLEVKLITAAQMTSRLIAQGYSDEDARLLTEAASMRLAPAPRPMPQVSVERAYVAGVVDRSAALALLAALGLSAIDSGLILTTLEEENPEAFGEEPIIRAKRLSPAALEDLRIAGLITSVQMKDYLVALKYSEVDANLMVQRAEQLAVSVVRPLAESLIGRAYVAGVVSKSVARGLLTDLGISSSGVDIILTTLEKENPEAFGQPPEIRAKQLTPAAIEDLRIAGLITSAQMKDYLITLKYSETDVNLMVQRAEQLTAPIVRPLTEPLIERAYFANVLTRDEAKSKLLSLAFSPDEAENILRTVDVENAIYLDESLKGSRRLPSITALAAAVKNGILTEDQYLTKAHEMGYTQEDALIYLVLVVQEERKATTTLSVSQITAAYDAGIMPWSTALSRITSLGYSDEDARLILRTRKDLIENTDVWYSLATGDLAPLEAINQLVSAGYSDEDVYNAFTKLTPSILANIGLTLDDLTAILKEVPGGR